MNSVKRMGFYCYFLIHHLSPIHLSVHLHLFFFFFFFIRSLSGGFGLTLDECLCGSSESCATFRNAPLNGGEVRFAAARVEALDFAL